MPTPDTSYPSAVNPWLKHIQAQTPEPGGAFVPEEVLPAVRLSRDDWERLKEILSELQEIRNSVRPRPLETALISGGALLRTLQLVDEFRGLE